MAAIVLAAGRSSRLGGAVPKPFLRAAGKTLLAHSLDRFEQVTAVTAVVVVVASAQLARARRIARRYGKLLSVVPGGAERSDSVHRGLLALPREFGFVLIHDAARPLVSCTTIAALAAATRRVGAAVTVSSMADTVKEIRAGRIARTLDRSRLVRAETPQGFRRDWLEAGFARAGRRASRMTDDASLVERLGHHPIAVPSDGPNFKITTAVDLELARLLLTRRRTTS